MNEQFITTIFGEVPAAKATEWRLVENYFQPIKALYLQDGVTEIFVDKFDNINYEQNGQIRSSNLSFETEVALDSFITQLSRCLEQPLSKANPILDARLPDCSRVCCTSVGVTPQGATLTLRIAPKTVMTTDKLIEYNALPKAMFDVLIEHIKMGSNIIVSGNTGSGKTTLLRALAQHIPPTERVVTCEDTQELYLDWLPFRVSLEAPKREESNVELKTLIETALRMRPDRIWVGEIRHSGAADAFIQAINTGHSGCITTLHANSCIDAVERIQYLISSSGLMSYELAGRQVTGSVDLFIQASRSPIYGRKITEIMTMKNHQPHYIYRFKEEN
ncbi:CpaF family protein [Vibrio algivorus]|uniref:CpaF family protein n=1 Tax=Vibrio algivorus TaxID=1667024 RepID=A0A557PGW2_9VIBR|nr:ATPase, T2SS/T4P/T4SS family [Vibrio algivorus]TVO39891.1 CpaF family protein [Vibrio algivorus]